MVGSRRVELGGAWVLVTGASSGLGRAIAQRLASHERANLILSGRRADALESVSEQIRSHFAVEIEQVVGDLTDDTNVRSTLTLLHRLLPTLHRDGDAASVLIVSSAAGIAPVPYQAAYTGSKAFLIAFGQALRAEMQDTGISVSVFAPAGIATEMLETSGLSVRFRPGHPGVMTAERAAARAVDAMVGGKGLVVPGAVGTLGLVASRILPRRTLLRRLERTYRPATSPDPTP